MAVVTNGFNNYVKDIKDNEVKAKELQDIKNRMCTTCKHNKMINVGVRTCTLLNRHDMYYCSLWERM